jgi:hypothetical protein
MRTDRSEGRPPGEKGSVSLELVGAVPVVILCLLVGAQIVAAGYSLWSAGIAARAGARAVLTGRPPDDAAIRALPSKLADGAEVRGRGPVRVSVRIPALIPGFPEARVTGSGSLGNG